MFIRMTELKKESQFGSFLSSMFGKIESPTGDSVGNTAIDFYKINSAFKWYYIMAIAAPEQYFSF